MAESLLKRLGDAVARADLHRRHGRVSDLIGLIVEATGLEAEVGEVCEIATGRGRAPVPAEVVGFRKRRTLLMPLGELHGIGPGNVGHRHRRARPRPRRRRAAGPRARRPRPPDRSGRAAARGPRALGRRRPAGCARAPAHPRARGPRRARPGRHGPLRARPAPGHLRRLRRGQVVAAGHDRPLDDGRHQRHLPRRRAWSRGARVHRARPRRRHRPLGRRRGHLRPAGARAHQGRAHRDLDRRALPRQGPRRAADDGLRHALRQRPARGRPGHRRAARHPRLHAQRLRPAAQAARALGHARRTARSPACTPCSSTATT